MMKSIANYDVLVIGAGQAGIPLARKVASTGRTVAVAERAHLGGSCVNFGCSPTKAVIASARVAYLARRAADFGVVIPNVAIDYPKVLARARGMVEASKRSLAKGLSGSGTGVLTGHCRFTGRDGDLFQLTVGDQIVSARSVVINTGTRTQIPAVKGLEQIDYLHAGKWLDQQSLPDHLIIVGAGFIALEMAQFYRRMGAAVTIVGSGATAAEHEDADVAAAMQKILEDEGVAFCLRTKATAVLADATGVRVSISGDNSEAVIKGSHLFLATGRKPNTDDLGLETIGLAPRENGTIEVDDRLATKIKGVWAAGDVRGGPMFTSSSWDDHRVLESQLLGNGSHTVKGRIVPYAIFTDPELGRVGMTEAEARKLYGERVKVATFKMKHNGKAVEVGEPAGFIKLVADGETGELLGAAVLAVDGAELVGPYITLMNAKASFSVISDGIYIHPTLTEAVQSAASAMCSKLTP